MRARQAKKLLRQIAQVTRLTVPPGHLLVVKIVSDDVGMDTVTRVRKLFRGMTTMPVAVIVVALGDDDVQLSVVEQVSTDGSPILPACPQPYSPVVPLP